MNDVGAGRDELERAGALTRKGFLRGAAALSLYATSSGLLVACGGDGDSDADPKAGTPATGNPVRGGVLRVGVAGGAQETLYPFALPTVIDIAQSNALYDKLARFETDGETANVVMMMAEEVEPSKNGAEWTVRLREGLVCHDGQPFTADDVVYSFAQILDPKSKSTAGSFFPGLTGDAVKAVDPLTVRFTFEQPTAEMPTRLALTTVHMVRKDHDNWLEPIGTGPFRLAEFKPGERTVLERFDEYWQEGKPYIDRLELFTLNEATQRINALRAGQVDAIASVDPTQARVIESEGFKLLDAPGSRWFPIVMKKKSPPFDDARVRQAFRLMMDRRQFVDNVYEGRGIVGNDLFSPFDPAYASDLPQREQDLEQARSLLQQAGQEGLRVKLPVADYAPEIVPMGTLLAAAAKEIGVTVELERANAATYFDDVWNKRPMFCSEWSGYPVLVQMLYCIGDKASSEETDETSPRISSMVQEASRAVDDGLRNEILFELQQALYDDGGYLIPGFPNNLDAHSDKVQGLVTSPYGNFGLFDFSGANIRS